MSHIRTKYFLTGIILLLSFADFMRAQTTTITLQEAFEIAKEQSTDALSARNQFLSSYWQYRNYRADLLPNVVLSGTTPNLSRSLSAYQKENGTYGFVKNNMLSEDLTLSVTQNVPFTGGNFSIQSQLQRIDQLGEDTKTGYLSVPFSFTLQQPLFTARTLRWAMRIEPERYKEAKQQYQVDIENIHLKTISYYFDLLLAMTNLDITKINSANAYKLFDIAQGKRSLGLISQNELYQLELGKINADAALISAQQNYDNKILSLLNFLRIESKESLQPVIPETYSNPDITLAQVMETAYKNNPVNHTMQRRLLESQLRIDAAKADRGFQADLYVSLGYTGSDLTLPNSYRHLQNRQIVNLGIRIPVLDWGKGKGRVKLAESEREVVKSQVEQTRLDFDRTIVLSVSQFQDQSRLVSLAQQADSIAQLRYETAFQTFVMGTINVLDINAAQVERDNAKRKYINELYFSWLYYYNLRQITLFDFENNSSIMH